MPVILNCLDKENTVQIGGNHFTFKPRQLKYFHDKNLAGAIDRLKREDGFISVPDSLEHLALMKEDQAAKVITDEDKAIIDERRKEGINTYCKRLRELVYNATVSVQKDIDRAGYKYDARIEANRSDLTRLEELAHYQAGNLDQDQKLVDKFKELEKKVAKTAKG